MVHESPVFNIRLQCSVKHTLTLTLEPRVVAQDSSVPSAPESHNCSMYAESGELLADLGMGWQWAWVDIVGKLLAGRLHTAVEGIVAERTAARRNVAEGTAVVHIVAGNLDNCMAD